MQNSSSKAQPVTAHTLCMACGCLCDDVEIHLEDGRPIAVENACPRGTAWLLAPPSTRPACVIQGKPASAQEGARRAAELLLAAQSPLVFGLAGCTAAAQRRAVGIADRLGAALDTETSLTHAAQIAALQNVGASTCTFGEIRHRADLVIFWNTDVLDEAPRLFSKYLEPAGKFVPGGRAERTIVAVDPRNTETARRADCCLPLRSGCDFEGLWTLQALAQNIELDEDQVLASTGVPLDRWQDLLQRIKQARYAVFCYGQALLSAPAEQAACDALFLLVREMNRHTRCVACPIAGHANRAGADAVLTWQTGFPFAVNFARGYPRYGPGEYTAARLLARREVDAALVVGSDPLSLLESEAGEHLQSIPLIAIDGRETETTQAATVAFCSAPLNLASSGTVFRTDGVPLPLRAVVQTPYPSAAEILTLIQQQISKVKGPASS